MKLNTLITLILGMLLVSMTLELTSKQIKHKKSKSKPVKKNRGNSNLVDNTVEVAGMVDMINTIIEEGGLQATAGTLLGQAAKTMTKIIETGQELLFKSIETVRKGNASTDQGINDLVMGKVIDYQNLFTKFVTKNVKKISEKCPAAKDTVLGERNYSNYDIREVVRFLENLDRGAGELKKFHESQQVCYIGQKGKDKKNDKSYESSCKKLDKFLKQNEVQQYMEKFNACLTSLGLSAVTVKNLSK